MMHTMEETRHKMERTDIRKTSFLQLSQARDDLIDSLSEENFSLGNKLEKLKQEISDKRHERNKSEMEQLKLKRKLNYLKEQNFVDVAVSEENKKETITHRSVQ